MKKNVRLLSTFAIFLCFFIANANAVTDIMIQGAGKRFPIAVASICNQTSHKLEPDKTIISNLDVSGYFNVLNPDTYIEAKGKCDNQNFAYSDWSVIGAEGLVKGEATGSDSNMTVKMYLHDVARQGVVVAKEYIRYKLINNVYEKDKIKMAVLISIVYVIVDMNINRFITENIFVVFVV